MSRCEASVAKVCPSCRSAMGVVRRGERCGCALVLCRCDYGALRFRYVEDECCRGECVVARVAWRIHLAPTQ